MPPFFIALCGSIVGASPQFTQPFLQRWPFGLFPDARVLCLRTDFVRSRCVYPDSEEQDCFVPLSMCPPGGAWVTGSLCTHIWERSHQGTDHLGCLVLQDRKEVCSEGVLPEAPSALAPHPLLHRFHCGCVSFFSPVERTKPGPNCDFPAKSSQFSAPSNFRFLFPTNSTVTA